MEFQVVPPGGDKNTGPIREAVGGVILSIAFVFVCLRFYVRARIVKKRLWWDDFFLLLGLLFSIAIFGLSIAGMNSGLGRHVYYLSPKETIFALKLQKIAVILIIFSLMFTKTGTYLYIWSGLEKDVAIIAAAIPALRPLWAKSANQNQIDGHQVRWPNNRQRLNSTYAMTDQQMGADSLPSRLGNPHHYSRGPKSGDVGSKVRSPA